MRLSKLVRALYVGLLQFLPFFRVARMGTVVLGIAMIVLAFV